MSLNITSNSDLLNISVYLSSKLDSCNDTLDITEFDFKEWDFPRPHSMFREFLWYDYIKISVSIGTIIAVLVGNIAVIIAVIHNRSLRTNVNVYLANLAVADILISVCCIWVLTINDLTEPLYILGPVMCKINGFAQMTCLTASSLTLTAISLDRFVAIMCPLRVRVIKQRTSLVIAIIWLISLFVSLPFLIFREYYEFQWRNFTETNCIERWSSRREYNPEIGECQTYYPLKKLYYTLVTVTLFFIPVVIMTTVYTMIAWKLWVNRVPGADWHFASFNAQNRAKKKVIKMVCVVLLAFVISWTPLQIIVLYSQFGHSSHDTGELPVWFPMSSYFATFIAYSNSAFNPILYGGLNKNFRSALYTILVKCKCGHKEVTRFRRNTVANIPTTPGFRGNLRGTPFATQETQLTQNGAINIFLKYDI